jgi:hypothetical protein
MSAVPGGGTDRDPATSAAAGTSAGGADDEPRRGRRRGRRLAPLALLVAGAVLAAVLWRGSRGADAAATTAALPFGGRAHPPEMLGTWTRIDSTAARRELYLLVLRDNGTAAASERRYRRVRDDWRPLRPVSRTGRWQVRADSIGDARLCVRWELPPIDELCEPVALNGDPDGAASVLVYAGRLWTPLR